MLDSMLVAADRTLSELQKTAISNSLTSCWSPVYVNILFHKSKSWRGNEDVSLPNQVRNNCLLFALKHYIWYPVAYQFSLLFCFAILLTYIGYLFRTPILSNLLLTYITYQFSLLLYFAISLTFCLPISLLCALLICLSFYYLYLIPFSLTCFDQFIAYLYYLPVFLTSLLCFFRWPFAYLFSLLFALLTCLPFLLPTFDTFFACLFCLTFCLHLLITHTAYLFC